MTNSEVTIDDLLDELEEWLEELKDILDDIPEEEEDPDPETEQIIEGKLNDVEAHIDRILDPQQSPSLNPPSAGSIDTSITPTTRTEIAQATHTLAKEAHEESKRSSPDDAYIGTRLKTIRHLLPGYRDAVGIGS